MFKCAVTGQQTKPGEPMTKVVTERRQKDYTDQGRIIGSGWEIVKEITVSPEGFRLIRQAEQREAADQLERNTSILRQDTSIREQLIAQIGSKHVH
jgi:hypothetical protein